MHSAKGGEVKELIQLRFQRKGAAKKGGGGWLENRILEIEITEETQL